MTTFRKAERKRARIKMALAGPSGSGKTYSSLLIAKGLGGPVAFIDTENGSGELYADHPGIGLDYDVAPLEAPYSPERYIKLIVEAEKAGYNVVIIDSLSHAWMGEGGLLEMVDKASKGLHGNSFAAWREIKPYEKRFFEALLAANIHIIGTLRTKTAYEVQENERGRKVPVKIGLKPEQREGLEYEFTLVLDMTVDGNIARANKDRTGLFKDFFVPNEKTGETILEWLNGGAAPKTIITATQRKEIVALAKKQNITAEMPQIIADRYQAKQSSELTEHQASDLIMYLKNLTHDYITDEQRANLADAAQLASVSASDIAGWFNKKHVGRLTTNEYDQALERLREEASKITAEHNTRKEKSPPPEPEKKFWTPSAAFQRAVRNLGFKSSAREIQKSIIDAMGHEGVADADDIQKRLDSLDNDQLSTYLQTIKLK